jgi:hypothetical protein
MATRKPNLIVKHLEIVIACLGLLVFLIVCIVSMNKLFALYTNEKGQPRSITVEEINAKSRAYEDWYASWRGRRVDIPKAADLSVKLSENTVLPQKPDTHADDFLFHETPYIHLPKQKEDAYYIGNALLTAQPDYNTVKVTVTLTDFVSDKKFQAVSPTTQKTEDFSHLDPGSIDVKIIRGTKKADGTIAWAPEPYSAVPSGQKGVFAWEDRGDIKGVTDLYYKATVQSKVPYVDAKQLKGDAPKPAAEVGPVIAALNEKGKDELAVTTLSPWVVTVSQIWNGANVDITIEDLDAKTKQTLNAMTAGNDLDDTTYRLINIISPTRFIITIQGNITKIELSMGVVNAATNGQSVAIAPVVWEADPFNALADNTAIIEAFVKQAFDAMKTGGKLNLGGAEFDHENNFIANILWRAILTYPMQETGKLADALGRQIQQYEYQPEGAPSPVKLIPFLFTEGVGEKESVVLHISPTIKDSKVTYWVEYASNAGATPIPPTLSGPYEVQLSANFDMSPADKLNRVINAREGIAVRIRDGLKSGAFAKAADPKPNFVAAGPISTYGASRLFDGIGTEMDDLGMKTAIGATLKVVIQYVDKKVLTGARLMESPAIPREKYSPPPPTPKPEVKPEDEFAKKLAGMLVLSDKNPKDKNIEAWAAFVDNSAHITVTLDQTVKFEGWDKVAVNLELKDTNISVNDLLTKIIDAFNTAIKDNAKAGGKTLVREDRAAAGEIVLKLEQKLQ